MTEATSSHRITQFFALANAARAMAAAAVRFSTQFYVWAKKGNAREAAVPVPATLQCLAKADGRWQFKRLTWRGIELPNYCLLKIT